MSAVPPRPLTNHEAHKAAHGRSLQAESQNVSRTLWFRTGLTRARSAAAARRSRLPPAAPPRPPRTRTLLGGFWVWPHTTPLTSGAQACPSDAVDPPPAPRTACPARPSPFRGGFPRRGNPARAAGRAGSALPGTRSRRGRRGATGGTGAHRWHRSG